MFYRKAWLSNKLKGKGIKKEVWGIVGSSLLGSLITLFIDPEGFGKMLSKFGINISGSILSIYIFFAIVMLIYKVYSSARNAMDTARTGIWEYELSYIDSAIEEHLEKSSPYNIKKTTKDSHKD